MRSEPLDSRRMNAGGLPFGKLKARVNAEGSRLTLPRLPPPNLLWSYLFSLFVRRDTRRDFQEK
jgi:hypothetical protein